MTLIKKVEHFQAEGEFVVTRAFKTGGRRYDIGDPFDWKKLDINPRRLKQLYYAGFIEFKDAFDKAVTKREKTSSSRKKKEAAIKKEAPVKTPKAPAAAKKPAAKKSSTKTKKPVK